MATGRSSEYEYEKVALSEGRKRLARDTDPRSETTDAALPVRANAPWLRGEVFKLTESPRATGTGPGPDRPGSRSAPARFKLTESGDSMRCQPEARGNLVRARCTRCLGLCRATGHGTHVAASFWLKESECVSCTSAWEQHGLGQYRTLRSKGIGPRGLLVLARLDAGPGSKVRYARSVPDSV
eukprot:1642036-Rhodomonas_salina.4